MKRILFQGDSITDCSRNRESFVSHGTGYAFLVRGQLYAENPGTYETINRGISGNRIVDVYARIKKDIINLKPDYMSILIGVNDVSHEIGSQNGVDAEKFEMIYDMLISEVKEALPDIKIMIMEPFVLPGSATVSTDENPARWDSFSSEVPMRAAAAKRIAEKHGLKFIPLQNIFDKAYSSLAENDYWLSDGVHPTAAGHTLIKNAWLKAFGEMK